jgi:transcriptional regulator with XRE-family HTH domain
VPLRRQLREAVEAARRDARTRGQRLTWQEIARRSGITSPGAMRKMLQGEAPIADATAARIAAAVGCELVMEILPLRGARRKAGERTR